MIRISAFIWIIVLALLGVGLFQVKYNVQSKEAELRGINKKIEANRSAIHVLEAEWSYLNDPTRLADLTRRHTDLTPTQAAQLKHFTDLPPRPATAQPDLPALTPPPLVSSAQPTQPQPASNVIPASVTSPATALSTSASANASTDAGNAAGAKAVVTQVSAKSGTATAVQQPAAAPATNKAAASTVTKPGADEVIDAILSDMQRQQGAAPGTTAGDQ
jgi:hypothetical protein